MNKHTPGPWTFKYSSGAGLGIWADVSKVLSKRYANVTDCPIYHVNENTPNVQIAYELWTQFPREEWDLMQQANGLLMAAAPELLAMVESQYKELADINNQWQGRHTMEGQAKLCRLRDLIAKATNRTSQEVQDS